MVGNNHQLQQISSLFNHSNAEIWQIKPTVQWYPTAHLLSVYIKFGVNQEISYLNNSLKPHISDPFSMSLATWEPQLGHRHYNDVIMGAIASQSTSLTIVCSTVYLDLDQRKHKKIRVTGLCAGNSLEAGEFRAQMASNAGNVYISLRHHATWSE